MISYSLLLEDHINAFDQALDAERSHECGVSEGGISAREQALDAEGSHKFGMSEGEMWRVPDA
jgi:hypothetical protein